MPRMNRISVVFMALVCIVFATASAHAELRIDISQGTVQPMPIAIVDFFGQQPNDAQFGGNIAGVVSADLERSGLFKPIDRKAFIQTPESLRTIPRFGDWRVINAQALVSGTVETQPDGRLRVEFRLWDVYAEQQMIGVAVTSTQENWRAIAHKIADEIYTRLTGEEGYFETRIVYVAETGPFTKRIKRLAIMDQDGENNRYLTDGGSLVLTPRFSPSSQDITYLSYRNNRPRVYLLNIETGQQEVLGDFPGMTFAPRFSPDGSKVVMSLAYNGNSDIYEMDLRTRKTRRLTDNPAIDTSPSYSPDGTQITFESDRGGSQQIYVMNSDGSNPHRISFGDGKYGTPVWSPRGDQIAYTHIKGGVFYIGVMHPDGSGERSITQGYLVEGPTWAPNGRVLAYFKQSGANGQVRIYSIDVTGYNEREMVTPTDASDPAWSPLIQ